MAATGAELPSPQRDGGRPSKLHVAIVGGGITGLTLAVGLEARGIDYTVYERADGFREVGAGIGFSPNAERAMQRLDPRLHEAFTSVATPNGEDYFQWIDGHSDEPIYRLFLGEDSFRGCRRSDILERWWYLIPPARIRLNKQLESASEQGDGRIELVFRDGSVEWADLVVGCDGVRSLVRQLILGKDSPAAKPSYSKKFCFRAVVPIEEARTAIGEARSSTRFMYNGPGAHAITYPVAMGTALNVLVVVSDPDPWPVGDGRHTAPGHKSEAVAAFADWHSTARAVVDLLPDQALDKWAIFDMCDNPAASYVRGRFAVAGDAAHAAGPHLGAGAGFSIEDSLVLATALDTVVQRTARGGPGMAALLREALAVYSRVRLERTQWLVRHTRAAVDLFQWADPLVGNDGEAFGREISWRFHYIWNGDTDGMVEEARSGVEAALLSTSEVVAKVGG